MTFKPMYDSKPKYDKSQLWPEKLEAKSQTLDWSIDSSVYIPDSFDINCQKNNFHLISEKLFKKELSDFDNFT